MFIRISPIIGETVYLGKNICGPELNLRTIGMQF